MRTALERWPARADALRSLGTMAWLKILFTARVGDHRRLLGPMQKQYVAFKPPPAPLVAEFIGYVDRAAALAQERLRRKPGDLDALYDTCAWASRLVHGHRRGPDAGAVRATIAGVQGSRARLLAERGARGGRAASSATYQYIIATLSWPFALDGADGRVQRQPRARAPAARTRRPAPERRADRSKFGLLSSYSRERRFRRGVTPSSATSPRRSRATACSGGTPQHRPFRPAGPRGGARRGRGIRSFRGGEAPLVAARPRLGTSSAGHPRRGGTPRRGGRRPVRGLAAPAGTGSRAARGSSWRGWPSRAAIDASPGGTGRARRLVRRRQRSARRRRRRSTAGRAAVSAGRGAHRGQRRTWIWVIVGIAVVLASPWSLSSPWA